MYIFTTGLYLVSCFNISCTLFLFYFSFWLCWGCPGIVYQTTYSAQATDLAEVFKRMSSLRNICPCPLKIYSAMYKAASYLFLISITVEFISTLDIIGVSSVFVLFIFSYFSFSSSCLTSYSIQITVVGL